MHRRHEQLSLRMALAAATHLCAQPRAKEGMEGETNDAPRRPKPPFPGRGQTLLRRCPSRRCEQPRSVTWLPLVLLSSLCGKWLSCRRKRWSSCGGLRGGIWNEE